MAQVSHLGQERRSEKGLGRKSLRKSQASGNPEPRQPGKGAEIPGSGAPPELSHGLGGRPPV